MEKEINILKNKFRTATEKEISEIDKEMELLSKKDKTAFSAAMISNAKNTSKAITELILKAKLKD